MSDFIIEPGALDHPVGTSTELLIATSQAISLKRIADALDRLAPPEISANDQATLQRLAKAGVVTERPAPPDKWVSCAQIAAAWDVSRVTLWNWRRAGLIPPWEKQGQKVGLRQSVVDATFERLKVGRPWLGQGVSK